MKKGIAFLLLIACVFSLCACGKKETKKLPDKAVVSEDTLPDQTAAELYNDAVEKLLSMRSYTMVGSVNSSSVMNDVLTSVVTLIDCRFETDENDNARMLLDAEQTYDGNALPHTTYFADGRYYISAYGERFVVDTNDFGDYDAAAIIKFVEDAAISNENITMMDDGVQVRFEIPYGVYASEALDSLIGPVADDSLLQQPITVRASINKEGFMTAIYLALENSTDFGGDPIEQSVIMSLQMSGYNETTVSAPEDLAEFEDRTIQETIGQNPEGEEPPEEFTGDSLD